MMFEPKRQHPAYILSVFLEQIKNIIIPLIILLVSGGKGSMFQYLFAILLVVLPVASAIIKWYRFTYYVTEDEFRIRSGLFVIENTFIQKERIQSISINAGFIQQFFNVVSVRIETAGGKKAEGILNAIPKDEALALKNEILNSKKKKVESVVTEENSVQVDSSIDISLTIETKKLFLAGITSFEVGIAFAVLASLFSQIEDLLPHSLYVAIYNQITTFTYMMYFIAFLGSLLLALIFSTIRYILKFANFTVQRRDNRIIISRGLFEKNEFTVSIKRIQGVVVKEGLLRQLFGYATIYVEAVGMGDKQEQGRHVLHPFIKTKDVQLFLKNFIPSIHYDEISKRAPKRARKTYYIRMILTFLLIASGIVLLPFVQFWAYGIVLIGIFIAELAYRNAGYTLLDRTVILQSGYFSRTTAILPKERIQVLIGEQSFFQKRARLKSIYITILSSQYGHTYQVRHLDEKDVNRMIGWFS
ncbi:PH domain-containing protein [Gottfriedia luciferensis]|uniref:PH domain-containing protein n=1 Tax=Gottfriedia luciferensis TaxID=178774 RepID=UPI0013028C8C|nr:PH domain-containing protein [Gottfriedia luciferensis]